MEHNFWHSKWQNNEIGFHEPTGNPFLVKYADVILNTSPALPPRIFVPLCGKTRDIAWLLSQQCQVIGAELSEIAIQQLFEELGVIPTIREFTHGKVYQKDTLTVFVGDIFTLTKNDIGPISAVYDRAALVALPEALRAQYTQHIVALTQCAPQLIVSFEYDQNAMPGPPFSVSEDTVTALYREHYKVECIERSNLEGGLKGKANANNLVFKLTPNKTLDSK